MTLQRLGATIRTGIEQNIIKDIENLKNSLVRMYENSFGYDLEELRRRLKKMKKMKNVVSAVIAGVDQRRATGAADAQHRGVAVQVGVGGALLRGAAAARRLATHRARVRHGLLYEHGYQRKTQRQALLLLHHPPAAGHQEAARTRPALAHLDG